VLRNCGVTTVGLQFFGKSVITPDDILAVDGSYALAR
jgi:hypothetical protein